MKRREKKRSGTAVLELAVCLPVIFVIVFGSIEACNMITLKQIATEAAYNGALVAVTPTANETSITASVESILTARSVNPQSVSVQGTDGTAFNNLRPGDQLTVSVEVLADGNVVGPQLFGKTKMLTSSATAIKQ